MTDRWNEKTGTFVDCTKCDTLSIIPEKWDRATVTLGPRDWSVLTGTVMRVGENTMRGQLLVAWEMDGQPYESSWHHPHELDVISSVAV